MTVDQSSGSPGQQVGLVEAYLAGNMSRRTFVRRLVAAGVSLSAAIAYTHALRPAPAQATHGNLYEAHEVVTTDATEVIDRRATLNGQVDHNHYATSARFEYGPTNSYGSTTAERTLDGAGSGGLTPLSAAIDGLNPGQTYHFRLVASNQNGQTAGQDRSFATPDTGRPTVGLEVVDSKLARVRQSGELRVLLSSDEAVGFEIKAIVREERSSGEPAKRIVAARGDGSITEAGELIVALKLTNRGRQALKGRDQAVIRVKLVATDPAGNGATARLRVVLE